MLRAMEAGLAREETEPRLPQSAQYLAGAKYTLSVMEQAPVTVFILISLGQMKNQKNGLTVQGVTPFYKGVYLCLHN